MSSSARSERATPGLRVAVRVVPGASRTRVGGRYGDEAPPRLKVAVSAKAVDGAANEAVVEALAHAFAVRRGDVRLVHGARSRSKLLEVDGPADGLDARLQELLGPASGEPV